MHYKGSQPCLLIGVSCKCTFCTMTPQIADKCMMWLGLCPANEAQVERV